MNNAQMDRLFDAAFEAAHESGEDNLTVDHQASWQQVQRRLNARRRRRSMRSILSKLAIVAGSLSLGALLFGNDRAVKAIEPIYASIKEYPSGLMNLIFGRSDETEPSKAKTLPPPAHLEGLSFERLNDSTIVATVTEAQASSLLSFRAPAFGYLPAGFSFDHASLYFSEDKEKSDYAIFRFHSNLDSSLSVIMQRVGSGAGLGAKNIQDNVAVQSLQLDDEPAILITGEGGTSTLETITNGIHFAISGTFTGEELALIYEGMRSK